MSLPKLFPTKQLVLSKINNFYLNNQSGYLCVPTGWGKTFLSKYLIKQYIDNGKTVLFIVSQNNKLLSQTAYHQQQKVFPNSLVLSSDYENIDVTSLRKYIKSDHEKIIFASLQTLLGRNNEKIKELLIKKIDLLVVDEIHNFIKNKGNDLISMIQPSTKIFGMTATPTQGILANTKHVDEICDNMKEIHKEYLLDCINSDILSKIHYTIINSGQHIVDIFDFTHGLQELSKQELTIDCSTTNKIQEAIKRTKLAKKIYDIKANPFSKTLIFCAPAKSFPNQKITSFHAKLSAMVFNQEPFIPSIPFNNRTLNGSFKNAVFLSSDIPKDEQQEILDGFMNLYKPPYILCTVSMLVEGFNFPDLQNLFLLRPTLSMRLFEQQIGRILRKPEYSQKVWGNVYEIADDIDNIYRKFNYQVFSKITAEQLLMLQPRTRIERLLFGSKDTNQNIDVSNIKISEITDRDELTIVVKKSIISQQIIHLGKMVEILGEMKEGTLEKENVVLQNTAAAIRLCTIEDIDSVSILIGKLYTMVEIAKSDNSLSCNCRDKKPIVLKTLALLLKLNVVSSLERLSLLPTDKCQVLKRIGCSGDIEEFKHRCIAKGTCKPIKVLQNGAVQHKITGNKRYDNLFQSYMQYCKNWVQYI